MQKIIVFGLMIVFAACECYTTGDGRVYDEQSKQPLSGATVTVDCEDATATTDSSGYFEIGYLSGGLFGCPDLKLTISMDGYEESKITNPQGDTIYLKK